MTEFQKELTALINKYSLENGSDTPDYILAGFLIGCLRAFDGAVISRRVWTDAKLTITSEPIEAAE